MPNTSAYPPIPENIGELATPPLIGYMVNWMLYGTLCVQVYNYYLAFPRDRMGIKALVYVCFLLETLQTVLNGHDAYHIFGVGFGDMNQLASLQLSWLALPILGGIIAAAVEIFYSYRIYVLSKSYLWAGTLALVALLQGGAAVAAGGTAYSLGSYNLLQGGLHISATIWYLAGAIDDIAIAISLTVILLRADVSFKSSEVLVSRLVRLTVETGVVTATVSIIALVFFLIPGQVFLSLTATLVLARVYSNSMMVMLNSRTTFANGRNDAGSTVFMSTGSRFGPGQTSVDFRGTNQSHGGISVRKDIAVRRDNIELSTVVDEEAYPGVTQDASFWKS